MAAYSCVKACGCSDVWSRINRSLHWCLGSFLYFCSASNSAASMTSSSNKKSIISVGSTLFVIVLCSFRNLNLNISFDPKRITTQYQNTFKVFFCSRHANTWICMRAFFYSTFDYSNDVLFDHNMHCLDFFFGDHLTQGVPLPVDRGLGVEWEGPVCRSRALWVLRLRNGVLRCRPSLWRRKHRGPTVG